MKLRNLLFALLITMTATTLSAQTMTATAMASKARAARSVANDLRHKKIQRAASTVLKDKDVQARTRLDAATQQKLTDTNFRSALSKAKTDARKDPVTFGEKAAKEVRKYKKTPRSWFHRKAKKRSTVKK